MHTSSSCLEIKIFSPLEMAFAKKILHTISQKNEEEAFFLCFLFAASLEGHLCVELKEKLFPRPSFLWERAFFDDLDGREGSLEEKIIAGFKKFLAQKNSWPFSLICIEDSRIYLQRNHFFETNIAKRTAQLLQAKPRDLFFREKFYSELQERLKKGLLQVEQKEALEKSLDLSLSLIVGGPGTGKTFTAAEMISLFSNSFDSSKKKKFRLALAAPTGRAADHLKDLILKKEALQDHIEPVFSTLHSLLKIQAGHLKPLSERPLMADLIIVDEASMIDPRLMACLLGSAPLSSRLVLMGDAHQLPAVEGGSIFAEMAQKKSFCGKNFSTFLKRAMRFENESIAIFSGAILEGNILKAMSEDQKGADFLFLEEEKEMLVRFFQEGNCFFSPPFAGKVDLGKCFEHLQYSRLLCPLRSSQSGVDLLNQKFFSELMKRLSFGEEAAIPILITRNDAEKKLSNGTLGMIAFKFRGEKNPFSPSDLVYFWDALENNLRSFPLFSLKFYEYGFCLSVHKSQGSEFSQVVLLLPPGSERFGKEMLYTAATRAKKNLLLIGRKRTIEELFKRESLKSSGLLEKLQKVEKF